MSHTAEYSNYNKENDKKIKKTEYNNGKHNFYKNFQGKGITETGEESQYMWLLLQQTHKER
jgi:hypothetical protein